MVNFLVKVCDKFGVNTYVFYGYGSNLRNNFEVWI